MPCSTNVHSGAVSARPAGFGRGPGAALFARVDSRDLFVELFAGLSNRFSASAWLSDPAPSFFADLPGASLSASRVSLGTLPKRRVGLLGGSFNPAHTGHRHISLEALKRLDLDEVWWLVAPQNPLKPARGMAPFKKRLEAAAALANDRRIKVLDLEAQLGTHYTADTLDALQHRFPRTRFVWLMGADNLAQIRHWRRWTDIFNRVPIAVFARPTYCFRGLAELAAKRYAHQRAAPEAARRLAELAPPVWAFLPIRLDTSSATDIRSHRAPRRKGKGRKVRSKRR